MRTRSPSTASVPLASALEVTRQSASGQIGSGQSSTDGDTESEEDSSADEWNSKDWRCARFQGTLPLVLSARIPLEVFGLIIDEMDQFTSAAAALVCTAWHPRAMRSLYRIVNISSRTSFDILIKQCRASPHVKRWLATTRELVANDYERSYGNSKHHPFLQVLPIALVHAMPGVRTLCMRGGNLRFIRPTFFLGLLHFKAVTSLTLCGCKLNNLEQLWRIIWAFPQLTDLSITGIELTQELGGPACCPGATPVQSPRLQRLNIDIDVKSAVLVTFIDCMTHSGCFTSLKELRPWLVYKFENSLENLTKALEATGGSLTLYHECCTGVDCEPAPDGRDDHGNLSHNTALRSLGFQMNDICPEHGDQWLEPYIKWVDELYGVLSTVRSYELEYIKIQSMLGYYDHDYRELEFVLENIDLGALHEVMGRPYFDVLEDVEVKMDLFGVLNDSKVDDVGRRLAPVYRGLLRPWSDRGIVNVIQCGSGLS
ncbi:uncharacterized protein B0H18DRAFT_1116247 [Fomitopsis serialis]|uniref:uncharacterized protein n=1 Tax=Fomitopsis serialis TaxID=139415 RepID=UPI00200777E9|nr:uncharacterized protein B0H18DRAFT_1116247 [Neoantrodia serialis]KAH9931433.1 hypothetical protein B0H18DRAFT_1116247 [Neoantrodia serialis]